MDLKSVRHEPVQMQIERKPMRARGQRWQKQRVRLQEKERVGSVQGEERWDRDLPDAEKIFTLCTSVELSLPRLFQSAAHYGPAHVCTPPLPVLPVTHPEQRLDKPLLPPGRDLSLAATGRSPLVLRVESLLMRKETQLE